MKRLVLAGLGLLMAGPLRADVLTFRQGSGPYGVCYDTTLRSAGQLSSTNYSADPWLLLDQSVTSGEDIARALVWFPLAFGDATGQVPTGASVLKATLSVQVTEPGGTFYLRSVEEPWVGAEATWERRGKELGPWAGLGATPPSCGEGDVASSEGNNGRKVLDVTALAQRWADDPTSNHGLVLYTLSTDGVDLASSEGSSGQRPTLEVTFEVVTTPTPEPTPSPTQPPTPAPTPPPTPEATPAPTPAQTQAPEPTPAPTPEPSPGPTAAPTLAPTEPIQGETPTEPPQGETPTEPPQGETPTEPPQGETPTEPGPPPTPEPSTEEPTSPPEPSPSDPTPALTPDPTPAPSEAPTEGEPTPTPEPTSPPEASPGEEVVGIPLNLLDPPLVAAGCDCEQGATAPSGWGLLALLLVPLRPRRRS